MDLVNYSTRRGLRLSSAKFLLVTDYFDRFIDKEHANFSTSETLSVSELLGGVLGAGSHLENAPDDYIADWILDGKSDVQVSGAPEVVLSESVAAFDDPEKISGRMAIKFPLIDSITDLEHIAAAEQGTDELSEVFLFRSPKHFTAHLCQSVGIYFDQLDIANISVARLSFGAGLLRKPAWKCEPHYGVLLLEVESLPQKEPGLVLETAEVFSNSEMVQIVKDLEADSSGKLPFVSRWRLDNYAHEKILRSHSWQSGEKVLDVGCGYSVLPKDIFERYNVEMWAIDDPAGSGWERPFANLETAGGGVKYIRELAGMPENSELPDDYFDVVYTKLAAHFSPHPQDNVWRHMAQLLRKRAGSELILIVGMSSPLGGRPEMAMDILEEIDGYEVRASEIVASGKFDEPFWLSLDGSEMTTNMSSPYLYCAYIMNVLGVEGKVPDELKAAKCFTNPDTFYDSFLLPAVRACFRRDVSELQSSGSHTGAMMIKFKWS